MRDALSCFAHIERGTWAHGHSFWIASKTDIRSTAVLRIHELAGRSSPARTLGLARHRTLTRE